MLSGVSVFLCSFLHAKKTFPFMKREDKIGIFILIPHPLLLLENLREVPLMLENKFQANLIRELKERFPGCIVMKNDPTYIQGIPDLLVLYNNKWASLECKKSTGAKKQPNQNYYVERMNQMSFSRFISPENKEEVLNELQQTFEP